MMGSDPVAAFAEILRQRGIIVPKQIVADGRLHRCDVQGKSGKDDAAYILHLDGFPAGGCINWKDGQGWENFSIKPEREFTAFERQTFVAEMARQRQEREAEITRRHAEAAKQAEEIWNTAAQNIGRHGYLEKKKAGAYGVRLHDGKIVVPLRDLEGKLHSLQYIGIDGTKLYIKGGRVAGCFHQIAAINTALPLIIAEGYATAASIFEATGWPVVAAFTCGNMLAVAKAIRTAHPGLQLVFAADDDHRTPGNPGRAAAIAAAETVGGIVVTPSFGQDREDGWTDWNDLAVTAGADEVQRQIGAALATAVGQAGQTALDPLSRLRASDWVQRDIAPPDHLFGEIFSTTSRVMLGASTGIGKTNLAMAIALAMAQGTAFLHWQTKRAARILYVDGEMSRDLIQERLRDAQRRVGGSLDNLFVLSRDDFEDMPPLNTQNGQEFLDNIIKLIGDIDFIIFDNIMSLLSGDMKEEQPWRDVNDYVKDLTRRKIGQLWIHHTGHDTTHLYGTKTKEWDFDAVILLEKADHPTADISFNLTFTKARRRKPSNRTDFEPVNIRLAEDRWTSGDAAPAGRKGRPLAAASQVGLDVLVNTLAEAGETKPEMRDIPASVPVVPAELWRQRCYAKGLADSGSNDPKKKAEAERKAFGRIRRDLEAKRFIATSDTGKFVWIIRPQVSKAGQVPLAGHVPLSAASDGSSSNHASAWKDRASITPILLTEGGVSMSGEKPQVSKAGQVPLAGHVPLSAASDGSSSNHTSA